MAIKVYVSGISGNKEVKKRQQRVLMILDSKNIKYEIVDIAEPGNEESKEFMQNNSKCLGATIGDSNPKYPLPPQIFNDKEYCGDYDKFDLSNEVDEIEQFLKLSAEDSVTSTAEIKVSNGELHTETAETVSNDNNEAEAKQNMEEETPSDKPVDDNEVTASETENNADENNDTSKTNDNNVEEEAEDEEDEEEEA